MQKETVFHRILRGELPADVVYEDDEVLAFRDIHPKATTHLLFIPKQFVASVADAVGERRHLPGMLVEKARDFALAQGVEGYKLTFHVGEAGGQEVPYLHLHFLANAPLSDA